MVIDTQLVKKLLFSQFPQWKDVEITPTALPGHDNRSYCLGNDLIIRLPSSAEYADQVKKEQTWLPFLASKLSLSIPKPVAMGHPEFGYPYNFSIYKFLKGEPLSLCQHVNYCQIAKDLAQFLQELESISTEGGPKAGLHSFYRGGDLSVYAEQTAKAIKALHQTIEAEKALHLWKEAVKHPWKQKDVWVHGDISPGNLLALHGKLVAVIDFGQLCCGDPACDLVIAWTLFPKESRKVFFENLHFDEHTLLRAKAWALWKALIVAAGFTNPNNIEAKKSLEIINLLLTE